MGRRDGRNNIPACLLKVGILPNRDHAGWEACMACQVRHRESVPWRTGSLSYRFSLGLPKPGFSQVNVALDPPQSLVVDGFFVTQLYHSVAFCL